ncbi:hypothetical protein MYX82_13925 [Acidobacteria bacterium AH-259-D05]|nr:hypothetical protein [Acidobacteria bacterium AH-259-D05]
MKFPNYVWRHRQMVPEGIEWFIESGTLCIDAGLEGDFYDFSTIAAIRPLRAVYLGADS